MDCNNFYTSGNGNKCPLQVNYVLIYFTCDVNMTSFSVSHHAGCSGILTVNYKSVKCDVAFYEIAQIRYLGEVNMFLLNVLKVSSCLQQCKNHKKWKSFCEVKITNIGLLQGFLWLCILVQPIYRLQRRVNRFRPSVRTSTLTFELTSVTDWPLTLIFCTWVGHDMSSRGLKVKVVG